MKFKHAEAEGWYYKLNDNGEKVSPSFTNKGEIGKRLYRELENWIAEGNEVLPLYTPEELEVKEAKDLKESNQNKYDKWKEDRSNSVANIEVTQNNIVFQGDETSQSRMVRAIVTLPDDMTTVEWTAKNNDVVNLTRLELKSILADAGNQQSAVWNVGRPKV